VIAHDRHIECPTEAAVFEYPRDDQVRGIPIVPAGGNYNEWELTRLEFLAHFREAKFLFKLPLPRALWTSKLGLASQPVSAQRPSHCQTTTGFASKRTHTA
jgi:hypothetical protein